MARYFTPNDRLVAASAAVTAYPVTLAAWCRPSVVDAYQGIVALGVNGASDASNFQLRVVNTGVLQARAVDSGGSGSYAVSSSISSNAWSHAAGVFVSNTSRTVYLNGTPNSNTASRTVNPSAFAYSTIGCYPVTGSYVGFFQGRIAEAAWWAAELTADEIAMLAAGYSPLFVRPAALRAYVPLFGRGGASGHEEDWVGGLTFEQTGSPTVADHPRIIYPRRRSVVPVGAAAATAPTLSDLRAINVGATSTQWSIDYTFS